MTKLKVQFVAAPGAYRELKLDEEALVIGSDDTASEEVAAGSHTLSWTIQAPAGSHYTMKVIEPKEAAKCKRENVELPADGRDFGVCELTIT